MKLIKSISVEFWTAFLFALLALSVNIFFYEDALSLEAALRWMVRYFTFGNAFFAWFFLFIYLLFLTKFYIKLVKITSNYFLDSIPPSSLDKKELFYHLFQPFYLLAPIAIATGPFWTLLGNMSYSLRFTQFDEWLLKADFALFGSYPFISLPTALTNEYAISLLKSSYFSLAFVMSTNLIVLYLLRKEWLFRQAILAFLCSLLIGFPLFYAFPCQDPGNYFLRNLRGQTLSHESQQALSEYRPPLAASQTIVRIAEAETNIEKDSTVPISCFPSMHAAWGMFVVYFLFKLSALSLLITLPWFTLLLAGGVYFAQHYVVDYIVAIPVAIASLFLANLLLRFEAWYKEKTPHNSGGKNAEGGT